MKISGLSITFLLAVAWFSPASAGGIGYKTPAAALADLKSKPGVTVREENNWIVLNDSENHTIWSITTEKHPAHSTAIKRTFVKRDGQLFSQMNVLCGASKETCDQVVAQFRQIDLDMREKLQP